MLIVETPTTNDTFGTTTRAPLTTEQRDARVSLSVLRQMRAALNIEDDTPQGQEKRRLAKQAFMDDFTRNYVPVPEKESPRDENGRPLSAPMAGENLRAYQNAQAEFGRSWSAASFRTAKVFLTAKACVNTKALVGCAACYQRSFDKASTRP